MYFLLLLLFLFTHFIILLLIYLLLLFFVGSSSSYLVIYISLSFLFSSISSIIIITINKINNLNLNLNHPKPQTENTFYHHINNTYFLLVIIFIVYGGGWQECVPFTLVCVNKVKLSQQCKWVVECQDRYLFFVKKYPSSVNQEIKMHRSVNKQDDKLLEDLHFSPPTILTNAGMNMKK